MDDCVFCRIIKGEEKAEVIRKTGNFIVIKDINPQAAIHFLIVPTTHIKDVSGITDELWKEVKDIAILLAREKSAKGFKLIHNAGDAASIPHMQVHFLADVTSERAL
ncbi:MAG: Histidine triad protein [Microgenomates group bacterium GW2011_GWC1_37_8]|uniref:Histidine triad (HIT) protein n=1 Tax=Candidatus Woesebacteria bacterium GW2011_GWB1_38_8 TaxID=1618570 RepID=A0A0G0KZ41_9BACT|nr:MAG: Histidine triad protein [Microgenomates group bacterium GW2011_GWC1_37_8]KKQ84953.1 MAG: Histidine triad (HIT) protein [Candidatus Woesebacteria bacterium GW2011_GWB1_38_8]